MSMSLEEAMMTQRAVRRLLPDEVDDDLVLRCIELAQRAPTGSNGQNWEFVVVRDREVKHQLGRQYRRAWRLYGGAGRLVAGRDPAMGRILDAVQFQVDHFEEVPVLVVACLRGFAHLLPLSAAQTIHYGSIYPSVQNLLLAARSVGLGASLITLPLWNLWRVRRLLGLPWNVHPVCMVPMGWPRGRYGPTTRTPVGRVAHLDRYGNRAWLDPGR
jgi:nitroreductase